MDLRKSNIKFIGGSLKKEQKKKNFGKLNIAEKKIHYSPDRFGYVYKNGKYYVIRLSKKKHEPNFFYNSSL